MHAVLPVWASLFSNDKKWGTINISWGRMHQKVASPFLVQVLFLFFVQQPPLGQGLLIHEFSRSHNEAPQ
jgi:hypothetical protein